MRHEDFSRIADEEAAVASKADGIEYFVRTAPADGEARASISIHMLHPKSGESVPLFRPPSELEDMPLLIGMSDDAARDVVRESLAVARAIQMLEMDPDWRQYR